MTTNEMNFDGVVDEDMLMDDFQEEEYSEDENANIQEDNGQEDVSSEEEIKQIRSVDDKVEGMTLDEVVKKYEPLVHRFANTAQTNSVCNREDLEQEGRMALVIAFQTFDPNKGANFNTWSYHLVKDAIIEYQKQHLSVLSGGSYLQNVLRKAGRDASIEEIVSFGVSKKTAIAATYVKSSFSTVDYDELATVVGSSGLEKFDENSFDWKAHLTDEEIFVVGNYFGFSDEGLTMKEMGHRLNKSRKAISYMLNRALVKLSHAPGIEDYAFV